MIVSEKQAKKKRCCGSRGCGAQNLNGFRMCIAGECMAWVWVGHEYDVKKGAATKVLTGRCGLTVPEPRAGG